MRKLNIKKLSYGELLELRGQVQEAIEQRKGEEKAALRAKMEELAAAAGFDLAEIFVKRRTSQKRAKAAPKYRNPSDPAQTWAGRGRQPKWLVAEIKKGKKLDDYLIS